MGTARVIAAVGLIVSVCASSVARAQSLEVGASASATREPFESSLCHRTWGTTGALYASWWATDSLAVELRGAHLRGPASRIVAVGEQIDAHGRFYRSYAVHDERRTLLQGIGCLPLSREASRAALCRRRSRHSLVGRGRVMPPRAHRVRAGAAPGATRTPQPHDMGAVGRRRCRLLPVEGTHGSRGSEKRLAPGGSVAPCERRRAPYESCC